MESQVLFFCIFYFTTNAITTEMTASTTWLHGSCRPSFHAFLSLADFLMNLGPHWNHWCCSFAFFILLITQSLQRLLYLPHVYLVDEDFLFKAFFQLPIFSSFFCEGSAVIQIIVSFNMMISIINEIKIVVTVCRIQCNNFIHL